MSYDLFVFDADKAPSGKQKFRAWFETQTDWSGAGDDDISKQSLTVRLQTFYEELLQRFPRMDAVSDEQLAAFTPSLIRQYLEAIYSIIFLRPQRAFSPPR